MAKGCIFAKTDVLAAINVIESNYKKAYPLPASPKNNRLLKDYSKMAVITAGGWIEDGIKSLMEMSGLKLRDLSGQDRLSHLANKIYGFSYDKHLSYGIMLAFGAHGTEYIENEVGTTNLIQLKSSLGNLKVWRDAAAHSYSTTTTPGPSVITREINLIFPILKRIETAARKYRDKHF